jgi:hypothetical protein
LSKKKGQKLCQNDVKKLSKSCKKIVKKLSKSCHNKLSHKVVTIGPSNPKFEKPENLKEEATKNRRVFDDEEKFKRRSDDEETRHP